jgi:hypothetical protein
MMEIRGFSIEFIQNYSHLSCSSELLPAFAAIPLSSSVATISPRRFALLDRSFLIPAIRTKLKANQSTKTKNYYKNRLQTYFEERKQADEPLEQSQR